MESILYEFYAQKSVVTTIALMSSQLYCRECKWHWDNLLIYISLGSFIGFSVFLGRILKSNFDQLLLSRCFWNFAYQRFSTDNTIYHQFQELTEKNININRKSHSLQDIYKSKRISCSLIWFLLRMLNEKFQ